MTKILVLSAIGLLFLLKSCAAIKPASENKDSRITPIVTKEPTLQTETPEIMPSPNPTIDPHIETINLTALVDAWNSGDINAIKSLYTEDARIFTETEARNLQNQLPLNVLVSDEIISSILKSIPENMHMRILGQPIMIYDKLVAYTYRLESDTQGYNATGLLRYEGDKILLQALLVSKQLTDNNAVDNSEQMVPKLNEMISAWSKNDLVAATNLYSRDAIIISDEDMMQFPWRDFSHPPSIEQLLNQFSGWDPLLVSAPLQLENTGVFAWRWGIREYPVAYGVRMVKVENGLITVDIRFAIRPWEAQGKDFAN